MPERVPPTPFDQGDSNRYPPWLPLRLFFIMTSATLAVTHRGGAMSQNAVRGHGSEREADEQRSAGAASDGGDQRGMTLTSASGPQPNASGPQLSSGGCKVHCNPGQSRRAGRSPTGSRMDVRNRCPSHGTRPDARRGVSSVSLRCPARGASQGRRCTRPVQTIRARLRTDLAPRNVRCPPGTIGA